MDLGPHRIGQKKLVIKNWTGPQKWPKNYEAESWKKLEEAVRAIQSRSTYVRFSLENLNQIVANLVEGNKELAKKLHYQLKCVCEEHVKSQLEALERVCSNDSSSFLVLLNNIWREHCKAFTLIINLFLKLDRQHLDRTSQHGGLWETGIEIFGRLIMKQIIKCKTIAGLLKMIELERRGEQVDRPLLRSLVNMLSSVSLYSEFESQLFRETETIYHQEARSRLDELEIPAYLELAERRLDEEDQRANAYLENSTLRPLIRICENKFIGDHLKAIVSRGLTDMMINQRSDDLRRLYRLFGRDNEGYTALKDELNRYVRTQGSAIVVNPEKDSTMVAELLEFKSRLDVILSSCFENNRALIDTVQDAFKYFINVRKNRPAELIAKYVDHLMKSGNKVIDDSQLEKKLDEVMSIFRFIHGKDVFEKFYKNDLAKRLLHNRSASDDAEKAMLSKLKEECGACFTSKLEGMFKDMEISREFMKTYKKNSSPKAIELHVNVLTTGNWTIPQVTMNIPKALETLQEDFKRYYSVKNQQKKLTFNYYHSSLILVANYTKESGSNRKHELQVSLSQGLILLLFNYKQQITYADIREETRIDDATLKRQLQSLSCNPKARVLHKIAKGKDIKEDDVFEWNAKFSYKLFKLKINQVQIKETVEENKETNEQIFQDRQLQVDAAIVRIMKSKKSLSHSELMAELYKHLRFPITPPDLKKRIEHLIDRDFIERDPDNTTLYRYLA